MKNKYWLERGVTLIELTVVLIVMVFIMGTTASIFISMLNNQRKTLAEQELFNQMSYVVENVSRTLESAIKDDAGSCLGLSYAGDNYLLTHFNATNFHYEGVKFLAEDGICREFFLDGNVLKEKKGSSSPQNIISDSFNITYARFIIDGDESIQSAPSGDSIQHRVTFAMKVILEGQQSLQQRIIQTTASQRQLNIP